MDIGFIGAGNIAGAHLENLDEISDANVVAVCDVDEETAQEAAEPREAAVYNSHERLYEEESLDAVYICIPPFAHTDQEIMAAERGIDMFIEKPVALDLDLADRVGGVIAEHDVITQVGYTFRYSDLIEHVKELLEGRSIGLIQRDRLGGLPSTPWWRVKSKSGGQVVEMTTHGYDLMRYLAGDVSQVSANGNRVVLTDEIDFEESVASIMEHENGAISQINSSCAYDGWHATTTILADGVALELDRGDGLVSGTVDGESYEYQGGNDAMLEEDKAFVRAVQEQDPDLTRSPYADAVKTLEVTLSVYEAIEQREPVTLTRP